MYLSILLPFALASTARSKSHQRGLANTTEIQHGNQIASSQARTEWWSSLTFEQQNKLQSVYDSDWFDSVDASTQIAYAHLAHTLYDFINSDADAHEDDSYQSFAPIFLRTAFHSSGTYFLPDGSGGSNGGTIFQSGELQDDGNGCIEKATSQLEALFQGHDTVPLSDAVVIAAVVALDVMEFPRMDLVRVKGGRDMIGGTAFRDRLPSADDDPLELLTKHYGLTLSELVGLIGGAHNFGSAHGKCSGYAGQWTATPLSWFGPNGTRPTFFTDLLRDDWRWYEVCTFYNDTVVYKSIKDPFASGSLVDEEEEHGNEISLGCPMMRSKEPLICESQGMRGCDFKDGSFPLGTSPCDASLLQIRLVSDFFLKKNPYLRRHAEIFAVDADKLAIEFGNAFHKVTHLGMDRCGMNGHGCGEGTLCKASLTKHEYIPSSGSKVCVLDEDFMEQQESLFGLSADVARFILFTAALVVLVSVTTVIVMWNKMHHALAGSAIKSASAISKTKMNLEASPLESTNEKETPQDGARFLEM